MRTASTGRIAAASSAATRWSSEAVFIVSNMSSVLLLAGPSVPRATGIPAAR
jgi:hypothetical protein